MVTKDDKRKIDHVKNYYNHSIIFFTPKILITLNLSIDLSFLLHQKLSTYKGSYCCVMFYKKVNPTSIYIVIISYKRSIYFLIQVVFFLK